jgi:hypothetical protein
MNNLKYGMLKVLLEPWLETNTPFLELFSFKILVKFLLILMVELCINGLKTEKLIHGNPNLLLKDTLVLLKIYLGTSTECLFSVLVQIKLLEYSLNTINQITGMK